MGPQIMQKLVESLSDKDHLDKLTSVLIKLQIALTIGSQAQQCTGNTRKKKVIFLLNSKF